MVKLNLVNTYDNYFFSICDIGSPEERWVEYGDVFFQPAPSIVQFRVRYDR